MVNCTFKFANIIDPELTEVIYLNKRLDSAVLRSVRGKTTGPFNATGTFQWTRAVQALSLLVLRYVMFNTSGSGARDAHILSGGQGTLAASLDRAIKREALWLIDMFGVTARGIPVAKHLFVRSNSGLKRVGPVSIAINHNCLKANDISIILDSREVKNIAELKNLLISLEESQIPLQNTAS